MPFGVADRFEGGLAINGQEILVSAQSIIEMTVRSDIHKNLPSATIVINDKGADVTEGVRPNDGMPIDIMLGDAKGGPRYTGAFRIVGKPIARYTRQGVLLKINAVLDALAWSKSIVQEHFEGPSSMVMAALAGKAGLAAEVDTTSDKQVWLPNMKPLVQYAHMVARHGWAGPTSGMIFCVTAKGVMRYRDVNNLMRGGGKVFGLGGVYVHDFHAASKSAAYNSSGAYGATTAFQGLDGKVKFLNKIQVTQFGGGMSFGPIMAGFLGDVGSRLDISPIDCGNVHKKYFDAKHQNRRIKATYGNDIHLLLYDNSGLSEFDPVTFNAMHPIYGTLMEEFSGRYIVTGIVRTIKKGAFAERLSITNQG